MLNQKVWFLNSPDNAVIKYASTYGWNDGLVSLEAMSKHLSVNLKQPFRQNFTDSWLANQKLKFNQNIF